MLKSLLKYLKIIQNSRFRKFLPAFAFFSGFLWDSITLVRIDQLLDNFIVVSYLLLLGWLIYLSNLINRGKLRNGLLKKYQRVYPFIMQFLFGGLFSAYVIYYFKSASIAQPTAFLFLMALLLVLNEFSEERMSNVYLQVAFYFLSVVSFFIFFIPIVVKSVSFYTFLFSGIISILAVEVLVYLLNRSSLFDSLREFSICRGIPPLMFAVVFIFYILNWIPPVPVSLKFSGIYHSVAKTVKNDGNEYRLKYEVKPWYKPWKRSDDNFQYSDTDSIFCFTAVFATTDLETSIFHSWQRFDEQHNDWVTTDTIELPIRGGRDEGYRLYSFKTKIQPGDWRVEVRTFKNALLGRESFKLEQFSGKRIFTEIVK